MNYFTTDIRENHIKRAQGFKCEPAKMASRGFWLQRQYLCQPLHIVVFARDLIVKFLQRFLKINMYCLFI